jgi:hypothetical protein
MENSLSLVVGARDQNGAETDGTKWCHICFHIFIRKQKTNTATPETNMKTDTSKNKNGTNTVRTRTKSE